METEHLSADSESSFIHIEIDPEDYKGASPDDAIHDLLHPYEVNWPNDAYREFMEIISKHQLSNSVGDAFIKFFNKHSNLDVCLSHQQQSLERNFWIIQQSLI
jgi:hypothetical protein